MKLRAARLILAVALGAALVVVVSGPAQADGDPASDVLYFQDFYLPYPPPSRAVADQLEDTIREANRKGPGFHLKVAVIASPQDLGAVPSLFNKPDSYSRFLGQELAYFYSGYLLVAMPAGLGIYKNGGPTADEEQALSTVKINRKNVDTFVRSTSTAVAKLAGTTPVPIRADRLRPRARAFTAVGRRGWRVRLRYAVADDSGRSREVVRVYGKDFLLYAQLLSPLERALPGRVDSVVWRVPRRLSARRIRFCVLATDPSGNQSKTSCAPLRVR
jgi:hypothetical protein